VIDEIERRLAINNLDLKFEHYIKLLVSMVFEAAILPCQSNMPFDNQLIALFNTISTITSSSSGWARRLKKPTSVSSWNQFLKENQLLSLYPFIHNSNPSVCYIDDIKINKQVLKLPVSYIEVVQNAEATQDIKERIEQLPTFPSGGLKKSSIINFVSGSKTKQMWDYFVPNRFIQDNFFKIAATVVVGAGAIWLYLN